MFNIKEYDVPTLMNNIIKITTEQIKLNLETELERQQILLNLTGIEYLYSRWFNFSPVSLIDGAITYLNNCE